MPRAPADSIQARLYRRLDQTPGKPALAFVDGRGRFRWWSVEDAYARASAYGAGLAERGCGPGERCVLVLPSDEECAFVLLGALLAGAVPLLIAPPVLQQSRHSAFVSNLEHTLSVVRPRVVVAARPIEPAAPDAVFPADLAAAGGVPERPRPGEADTAALQLTSGTTGVPRVCRWTHRSVLAALDGMEQAMGLAPDDVCFNWTPLYHDMGLVNNFLLCLTSGVPLALLSPTDFVVKPARWLRGLSDTGATISWSPNFGLALATARIADEELDGVRLDRVRQIWNAAERVHVETMLDFHERFSGLGLEYDALKTNFGCAENVGGATFSDPDGPFRWEEVDLGALHGEGRAVVGALEPGRPTTRIASAGRPVPGMRVVIAGPDGLPRPDGAVGEVLLETPSRMSEYVGDVEATTEAFAGEHLRTGDLGYTRDADLFWVGRIRERITVRGKKIDPSEFERMLFGIPGLRPGCFAAFGVPDPALGTERPVVVCEVQDPPARPLPDIAADIHAATNAELGLMLADVVLVEKGTLAKTSSGKRRHRHFREIYQNGGLKSV
jgi:acyl-CoA synthetase (AMP-forming)/AMP-acid ligase II